MGNGDSRALPAPALPNQEHPVVLAGTGAVIKRFNRNTMLLATGLLGTVIFAALVLAVQERYQKVPVFTDEPGQTAGELSLNANAPALSEVWGLDTESTGEITSGPATNSDDAFRPEISQPNANARSMSSAHRQDPARVGRPKHPSARTHPSLWAKVADVFTFWHRKPVPTERSRGWAQFSKKRGAQKVQLYHRNEPLMQAKEDVFVLAGAACQPQTSSRMLRVRIPATHSQSAI